MSTTNDRYMIVPDTPGWAYDRKADAIIKHTPELQWDKLYWSEYQTACLRPGFHDQYTRVLLIGFGSFDGAHPSSDASIKVVGTMTSHEFIRRQKVDIAIDAAKSLNAVGAVSRDLLAHLKRWGLDAVYCPNGVDHEVFQPIMHTKSETFTVGWVGSKRPDDIKGFHRVLTPIMKECKDIAFDFIFADSLTRSGMRGTDAMVEYYNSIDVFLSTGELEGTPNPAFEAAACGVPVVATRTGSISDLLEDEECGFLLPSYHGTDPRETISCGIKSLTKLRSDPTLCARLGHAARTRILSDWTWADRVDAYYTLLGVS